MSSRAGTSPSANRPCTGTRSAPADSSRERLRHPRPKQASALFDRPHRDREPGATKRARTRGLGRRGVLSRRGPHRSRSSAHLPRTTLLHAQVRARAGSAMHPRQYPTCKGAPPWRSNTVTCCLQSSSRLSVLLRSRCRLHGRRRRGGRVTTGNWTIVACSGVGAAAIRPADRYASSSGCAQTSSTVSSRAGDGWRATMSPRFMAHHVRVRDCSGVAPPGATRTRRVTRPGRIIGRDD